MPTRLHPFPARLLSLPGRRWPPLLCWEKSSSSDLLLLWRGRMACRHWRLGATAVGSGGVFDPDRKFGCAGAEERSTAARLLSCRAWRLYLDWIGCWQPQWLFCAFLHNDLWIYPGRCFRRCGPGSPRERRRRSDRFLGTLCAVRHCWPDAWRFSCYRLPDCRHYRDFSANFICSAQPCDREETMDCCGSSPSPSSAASSLSIIT